MESGGSSPVGDPPSLQQAVLAAEDARFYSHHGIDAVGSAARS